LTAEKFKIEFAADEEFVAKMDWIRARFSGRFPNGVTLEKLFGILIDEHIEKHHPKKKAERRAKREEKRRAKDAAKNGSDQLRKRGKLEPDASRNENVTTGREATEAAVRSRHIPAHVREYVRVRDGGRCTWKAPDGMRCFSSWDLEVDHIKPFSLGGDHSPENLRILCSAHNRLEGERVFGRRE